MKTCKAKGCPYPVFSHLYCQRHQYHRTDKKAKKDVMRINITRVKDFPFGFTDQLSMFSALWENQKDRNGKVTCQYTGEVLNRFYGTELWVSCFAHVLSKGRFTYWKLNPDNIRIIFPYFHQAVDQGTIAERAKHPTWNFTLWDSEVIRLKEEYEKYKTKNLLR